MNLTNNTQNSTCSKCAAQNTTNLGRSINSDQDKQEYWKIIEFFYPDYNPFANEFSANDISVDVENIILEMSINFANCCKAVVPLEIMSIVFSIIDAANVRKPADVFMGMLGLFGTGWPGTMSLNACRNTQAVYKKSALYMAFLGI